VSRNLAHDVNLFRMELDSPGLIGIEKIFKIIIIIGTEGSHNILLATQFDLTSPLLRHGSSPPPLSVVRCPLPSLTTWFEVPSPLWWHGLSSPPLSSDLPLPLWWHRSSSPPLFGGTPLLLWRRRSNPPPLIIKLSSIKIKKYSHTPILLLNILPYYHDKK
jgi:hypothetical protein